MQLNEQQQQAVTYQGPATNILVTAGAGCGKTRTIIGRAIHLVKTGTNASRILMMTFTNRAAREMKARLKSELGPVASNIQAGTFHAFCLAVMSRMQKSFDISGLTIIDADDQESLITRLRNKYIQQYAKHLKNEIPSAGQLITYFSYSRNTCQSLQVYLSNNTDLDEDLIDRCAILYDAYRKTKKQRGYLDYDDLLESFSQALAKKPNLRQDLAQNFDEILVDEMQDTNPLQFSILRHFSAEQVRLFCVGDPAQSIYRFRGAEFKHVYAFDRIFGNSEIIPLSLNYRSYQEILDLSNWLLDCSPLNYPNKLTAIRGQGGCLPAMADFDSLQAEASFIADKIQERYERQVKYKDIMVLVRTSFDAKPIEAEFIRRKIPYHFIGGTSLTQAAHVRDVLSLLRLIRNLQDELAWMRFLKLWPRIGTVTADKIVASLMDHPDKKIGQILREHLGQSHDMITVCRNAYAEQNQPKVCVTNAIEALTPILKERYTKWDSRVRDLKLLSAVAARFKTIGDFIDAFTLEPMTTTQIEQLENEDAVLLITVHSAKGTEAPICFVANAKPGTYPHSRNYGDLDAEEEDRRVLYVAMTRAKNELFITRSTNTRSGFAVMNKPTVGEEYFLASVPDALVTAEVHGWQPNFPKGGLSSLKDIY